LGCGLGPRLFAANSTIWRVVRAGEEFTQEEFEAIEKLARERAIDFDEAKAALRAGRGEAAA